MRNSLPLAEVTTINGSVPNTAVTIDFLSRAIPYRKTIFFSPDTLAFGFYYFLADKVEILKFCEAFTMEKHQEYKMGLRRVRDLLHHFLVLIIS